ncbi:TlpA disulfide reductase family protein [uncultured Pedobacter sp.]|uniref:TlpA family protein disulfide reductase n=1 Tax=uncultured Pedobacter sp. TaxID=246139 RepID=UPI002639514C|nr:TlpA disulfide reductase family protein [uncultured Pedobacter sp.]
MNKLKIYFNNHILILLLLASTYCAAQDREVAYPKVGEQILDHTFTDLEGYPEKELNINKQRGKWLILDMWAYSCGGCVASFEKMDKIAKKFKEKVQVVMVGIASAKNKHYYLNKELMEVRRRALGLSFTVAYDTSAMTKYDARAIPYILVVNPQGIIVAKCTSVSQEQISELLEGKQTAFNRAFSAHEKIEYSKELPLLTSGMLSNGGNDTSFISRSLLVPYNYQTAVIPAPSLNNRKQDKFWKNGRYEGTMITLANLYKLAYFGTTFIHPLDKEYGSLCDRVLLRVADSSKFENDPKRTSLKGYYSYSLTLPKERISVELIKHSLREDLFRTFGYQGEIVKSNVIIYALVVVDANKVKQITTKGEPTKFYQIGKRSTGFGMINKNPSELYKALSQCIPNDNIFLNQTGLSKNVDIDIEGDIYSMDSMNSALERYGLKIVKTEKEMNALLISDRIEK